MTSPRDLLGLTAAAVAARTVLAAGAKAEGDTVAIPPSAHPYADLIRLAEQFTANEQAMRTMPGDAEFGTPEEEQSDWQLNQLVGTQRALTRQMGLLRATTAEGWRRWRDASHSTTRTSPSTWRTRTPPPAGWCGRSSGMPGRRCSR